jgi:hypothetical protein
MVKRNGSRNYGVVLSVRWPLKLRIVIAALKSFTKLNNLGFQDIILGNNADSFNVNYHRIKSLERGLL